MSSADVLREDVARRSKEIEDFASRHNLERKPYRVIGIGFLLLDLPEVAPLSSRRLQDYAEQYLRTQPWDPQNNCFLTAARAQAAGVATGRMLTTGDTSGFTGWFNHCINFEVLPDTTALAVDLTAGVNTARQQGEFDVLAIRALNLGELCMNVGELYGGTWRTE